MSASKARIYFLLQHAAASIKAQADATLIETGQLTTAQAAALYVIAKDGPVTQKRIAEALSQRESAITTMAARLLKANFIYKVRSDSDKRAWALGITAEGRNALLAMEAAFDKVNANLDASLTEDEIKALARSLNIVIETFSRPG